MMNPFGSELAHEEACDRRAHAVPRRDRPGRVRITIGRSLIGAGTRLTRSAYEGPSLMRRRVS
jgi:hypothetical protein